MPDVKQSVLSLSTLLNALSKEELQDIRRFLNVQKASHLNKRDLVQHLYSYMIGHLMEHLERLDHDRFSVLKKVMKASNCFLSENKISNHEYFEPDYFQLYGFLFPCDGGFIMPQEIREKLLEIDAKRLKSILDRNTEWVRLTIGILYFYGNLGIQKSKEKVEHYSGKSIDYLEYWNVISDLEIYNFSIQTSPFGFSHFTANDSEWIANEHRKRPMLEYYSLTKAQVLHAADDEYVDRHAGFLQFVSFLRKHWEMDAEEADLITAELVDRIQQGDTPSTLITSLQADLEFLDMDCLEKLMQALMALFNKTRQWALKGHTPEELFSEEQKHLQPHHPIATMNSISSVANSSGAVYNFQTKQKVGRNDPCPCGSGKKFKKCCGL